jgi:hypothetical protein
VPVAVDPSAFEPISVSLIPPRSSDGRLDSFDNGLGEWVSLTDEPGGKPTLDATTSQGGKVSLRITNQYAGGNFAVQAVKTPFDASQFSRLSFDYAVPAGVTAHWYLRVRDEWVCLRFADRGPASASFPMIGEIPDVICDGQWHHTEVDLQSCLRTRFPEGDLRVESMVLADWTAPAEVRWYGLTTNPAGAIIHFDNFALAPGAGT